MLVLRLEQAVFSLMLLVDEEEQDMFQEDFIRVFIAPVVFATESVQKLMLFCLVLRSKPVCHKL